MRLRQNRLGMLENKKKKLNIKPRLSKKKLHFQLMQNKISVLQSHDAACLSFLYCKNEDFFLIELVIKLDF